MSVKEILDAVNKGNVLFGIRQALKFPKNKKARVFVAEDARDDVIEKLEKSGVDFEISQNKSEIARALNLGFESEVFLVK